MSQDCLFCQIVDGQIPGRTVYEDEATLAFLDVNPLAAGHVLVIPKAHHEHIQDMPVDLAGALFETVREVTPAVEAAVDAPATMIALHNGEAAGQEIPHVHVHVVPRVEDDQAGPIHALFGSHQEMADDELDAIEADIADHL